MCHTLGRFRQYPLIELSLFTTIDNAKQMAG